MVVVILVVVVVAIIYNLSLRYETIDKLANCVCHCSTSPTKQKSFKTTHEPIGSTRIWRVYVR